MSRYLVDDARTSWKQSGFPLTIGIVALQFVFMALDAMRVPVFDWLNCPTPIIWTQPWRLLTYPLQVGGGNPVMAWLFAAGLLYFFGGSLERSWSTRTYAFFLGALTLVTPLALTLASWATGMPWGAGTLHVVMAVVVAWGTLNAWETVQVFFIPFKGCWLAALAVCYIFFEQAKGSPLMALVSLAPCVVAFLWVRNRSWSTVGWGTVRSAGFARKPPRPARPRDDKFSWRDLNPLERMARAKRKKQFERLFEDDK